MFADRPDDIRDVLRRALADGAWPAATRLVVERWPDLVLCEHPNPAPSCPAAILPAPAPPDEAVRADPELALAFVADSLEAGDIDAAGHYLRLADQHLDRLATERRQGLELMVEAFRLAKAQHGGDLAAVLSVAPRLLALSDGENDPRLADSARGIAFSALGMAQLNTGEFDAAQVALTRGLRIAEGVGLACPLLICTSRLALLHAQRGMLRLADATARTGLEIAPPCSCESQPAHSAHAYLALAVVHYQWDQIDDAARFLDLAARSGKGGTPVFALSLSLVQAWLLCAEGDPVGGHVALRAGLRMLGEHTTARWMLHCRLATEADILTARGHTDSARELLDVEHPSAMLAVALARTRLHDDDPAAAIAALPGWAEDETIFLALRLEAGILDALAARRMGDPSRAAESLEQVLCLAEPDGYRRIFTRGGPQLHALLADQLAVGTTRRSTAIELIEAMEQLPTDADPAPAWLAEPPTEPLTERELTVLRHLHGVQSIAEIASALFLSTNTIKTHVRHIYRKLDAAHRRQAIQRAKELRLL
jgi:LuxR family maltose regulon positive regulatory protein